MVPDIKEVDAPGRGVVGVHPGAAEPADAEDAVVHQGILLVPGERVELDGEPARAAGRDRGTLIGGGMARCLVGSAVVPFAERLVAPVVIEGRRDDGGEIVAQLHRGGVGGRGDEQGGERGAEREAKRPGFQIAGGTKHRGGSSLRHIASSTAIAGDSKPNLYPKADGLEAGAPG